MAVFTRKPGETVISDASPRFVIPGFLKWLIVPIVLLVLLSWLNPFATVPASNRGVVTTFGKVNQIVLEEGLHIVKPIADKVRLVNVQVQKLENKADAGRRDLQHVNTTIAINLRVDAGLQATIHEDFQAYPLEISVDAGFADCA